MDVEVQKQKSLFLIYNLNNKVIHSPTLPALEDWIILSFDIF